MVALIRFYALDDNGLMKKFMRDIWGTTIGYLIIGICTIPFAIIYAVYSTYYGQSTLAVIGMIFLSLLELIF